MFSEAQGDTTYFKVLFAPASSKDAYACLIGLAIRAKLQMYSPCETYKFDVLMVDKSHIIQSQIERQINDKERITSSFENP